MKIFAQIMGLLFGSAGVHTFQKHGQVALPPLKLTQFSDTGLAKKVRKHKIFLQHCLLSYWFSSTNFLQGGGKIYCLWTQFQGGQKSPTAIKCLRGTPLALPPVGKSHHKFDLSIQSFCPAALTYQSLHFCLFRKDSFDLTGSRYLWNFSHCLPSRAH